MNRTAKRYLIGGLAALTALSLAACSGGAPNPSDSDAPAELQKVKVAFGVGVVGVDTAWEVTAPALAGYWEEEGLDVEFVIVEGSSNSTQLLASGQVDFAIIGAAVGMQFVEQGADIISVGNFYEKNTYYPAVLESSDIEEPADFEGRKVGFNSLADTQIVWSDALMDENGVPRDSVEYIAAGQGAPAINALTNGQIDVYYGHHGQYATMEAEGGIELRRLDDDPLFTETAFGTSLWTKTSTVEENDDWIVGLMRGLAKGVILTMENPEAVVSNHFQEVPQSRPEGTDEEVLEKGLNAVQVFPELAENSAYNGTFGAADPKVVTRVAELLKVAGQLDNVSDPDRYFDGQFIDAANDFDADSVASQARKISAGE